MTLQYGLSEDIINQLRGVLATQGNLHRAEIFGSRARGDFKPSSDIDLAVYGDDGFKFDDYARLLGQIDELPIIFKVDVVDVAGVDKPALLESIQRDGVIFWEGKI